LDEKCPDGELGILGAGKAEVKRDCKSAWSWCRLHQWGSR
jgi:hypothetical protein